jgi:hypothetical protein
MDKFKEWIKDSITENKYKDSFSLYFPFFPLHDHGIPLYFTRDDGNVRIDDGGDTFGELFSNGYLVKPGRTGNFGKLLDSDDIIDKQGNFIKNVIDFHNVNVEDSDDVFWVECKDDVDEIGRAVMNIVQSIIQIYAVISLERTIS